MVTTKDLTKQTAIIIYSNIVVFFDFLIYLYLADTLSSVFFPNTHDPMLQKLQVFVLFAAGYVMRPLGGLIIGRLGDTRGRKSAIFMTSIFVMGTSLITACLPTYEQIGIIAPILFVTMRLAQGMGFASQSIIGWVFIGEHAPKSKLGLYISLISISFLIGVLFSKFIFSSVLVLINPDSLISYGWRLIFLAAALLSGVSLFLNRYLTETPAFEAINGSCSSYIPKYNDIKLDYGRFHSLFLSGLFSFYIASFIITIVILLPQLITMQYSVDEGIVNAANVIGTLFFIIGSIFYGVLADRANVGRALMLGSVVVIVQALFFSYTLENNGSDYMLITYAMLGFSAGVVALCPIIMIQLFATKERMTSVAIIYNTTYAIVGGLLPLVLVYTTGIVGSAPMLYVTFVGIIGLMTGQYIHQADKFSYLKDDTVTCLGTS